MRNKNKIITFSASLIAIIILVISFIFIYRGFKPKGDGKIIVEFVAVDSTIIKSKEITFNEGDSLIELIEENFDNVQMGTGSYNGMLMEIEDYVTPSDWSTFLSIYVNGECSQYGLGQIEFTDGTIISLRITEFSYEY